MESLEKFLPVYDEVSRRKFMLTATRVVGGVLLTAPLAAHGMCSVAQTQSWTVGQVMDLFIKEVPGAPFGQTVDTLKAGNRDIKVTGIVTTMFATLDVIQKAVSLNANFIIAHEPTFYNHLDDTSWLKDDTVYQYKADLLKKHNIAVWRNHDYIHRLAPDGVRAGVVARLKWESFSKNNNSNVFEIPNQSLEQLIDHVKENLGISSVRYLGDLSQSCKKVLLMPGAYGGKNQITSIGREKPDVALCGEISEWETAEYVRDARTKGESLALIVMGHVVSEEPGSRFLADWLKDKIKSIPTTHVPAGESLKFK